MFRRLLTTVVVSERDTQTASFWVGCSLKTAALRDVVVVSETRRTGAVGGTAVVLHSEIYDIPPLLSAVSIRRRSQRFTSREAEGRA